MSHGWSDGSAGSGYGGNGGGGGGGGGSDGYAGGGGPGGRRRRRGRRGGRNRNKNRQGPPGATALLDGPADANNPAAGQPGTSQPGTSQTGTSQTGTSQPGSNTSGTSQPGAIKSGASKPGAYEKLTSIDPQPRLSLEYPGCPDSCRLIDLFCPIGRGQRGLIVSPPKAGKTTLLKDIAIAMLRNHPDVELVLLLVDERPEEVTDFKRTIAAAAASNSALIQGMLAHAPADIQAAAGAGTPAAPTPGPVTGIHAVYSQGRVSVVASSNDHPVERHVDVATSTIARCRQLVEQGRHVVVLLDSLTRLGRAFNNSRKHANSGRTLTGGLDSRALEVPKMLFGSARNTEEAGSLTIIASCLVDTGSAADQIIFEEFKGTGNMELILDRKVSEKRLFPAINLAESGTRKENLLLTESEMKTMTALRRQLLQMPPPMQVERLIAAMRRFPTNAALVGGAG
jgi:transcription termination factor Rho